MKALILVSLATVSLAACFHPRQTTDRRDPNRPRPLIIPASQVGRAQVGDAARVAAQRCGPIQVFQRPGTDGTSPADYECERPKR